MVVRAPDIRDANGRFEPLRIEGNYAKGYLDFYFSAGKLKGEWVMVAEPGAREWRLIRPSPGRSYAPPRSGPQADG